MAPTPSHAFPRGVRALVALTLVASGCYSDPKGEEDPTADYKQPVPVEYPDLLQAGEVSFAMRVTDFFPGETDVNRALVNIAAELDIPRLLTRGGIPDDGMASSPAEQMEGSSIEQVAAYHQRYIVENGGLFPEEEAVDACGNPMVAAFIHPYQLQEALPDPTSEGIWPPDCADANCDDLQIGTLDVYTTQATPTGKLDLVINLLPDTSVLPPRPGLYGHMLGYFLTDNNPGFIEAPVVINASQMSVVVQNLFERQKAYVDPWGTRELYVYPGSARPVLAEEVLAVAIANKPEYCEELWNESHTGLVPYGCEDEVGVTLDYNGPTGAKVFHENMQDGGNRTNLDALAKAFEYSLRAWAVCPESAEETAYYQDGPVEIFICPPALGPLDECIAEVDMDLGACEPREGGYTEVIPQSASIPVPLVPAQFPYRLIGAPPLLTETETETEDTGLTDTGTIPTEPKTKTEEPLPPFVGTTATLQLTVEADTVLYLDDPSIVELVGNAANQPIELPEPTMPCDETDTMVRYDVGEAWGEGTYNLVITWSATSPAFDVGLSSVPLWIPEG